MKSDIIYAPVITEKTSALAQANTYNGNLWEHTISITFTATTDIAYMKMATTSGSSVHIVTNFTNYSIV